MLHVNPSLTGWTKLVHSFNFLKGLEMEICKDPDTCRRAEWWVLKFFLFFLNSLFCCIIFLYFLKVWVLFGFFLKSWLSLEVKLQNFCGSTEALAWDWEFVVLNGLQNIYSKTVQNFFRHSLHDEAAGCELKERQLWHGRHLALEIHRNSVPFLDTSCFGH